MPIPRLPRRRRRTSSSSLCQLTPMKLYGLKLNAAETPRVPSFHPEPSESLSPRCDIVTPTARRFTSTLRSTDVLVSSRPVANDTTVYRSSIPGIGFVVPMPTPGEVMKTRLDGFQYAAASSRTRMVPAPPSAWPRASHPSGRNVPPCDPSPA